MFLAAPLAAQEIDINGSYRAEGMNPDGSRYVGTARIQQVGASVQIDWQVGNQGYSGAGARLGQIVSINWGQPDPVVYVVMADGELHGTWADGRALERLIPQ
ncbi:MAG: hypothetical protein P1U53_15005 [Sulfitobacter sp.]|nr:hypothetical protein [Sulfitobacter sp.]